MSLGRAFTGEHLAKHRRRFDKLFGFIYWPLITPMVSPEIVGRAAFILAVVGLLLPTSSLGIPTGVMRFLGREYSRRDPLKLGEYYYSSLIFILGLNMIAGLLLLGLGLTGNMVPLDLESTFFVLALVLLGMGGWSSIPASPFNSVLATEYVTVASFVASLSRVLSGSHWST